MFLLGGVVVLSEPRMVAIAFVALYLAAVAHLARCTVGGGNAGNAGTAAISARRL